MVIEMQLMQPLERSLASKVSSSSHVWKQFLVSLATGLMCMCGGFTYGYSAMLVPSIKADQDFPYDDQYDSWIAAIAPLSMAFGCIFSGVMIDHLGRKYTHILLLWPFLIGYLVLGFSKSVTYLFLGRFLTGTCTGVFRSIGAVYVVEVTDPKHRAVFQFTLSLSATIGILGSHVIGKYLSVRHSCILFCTPIFVAFVIFIFLKESPLWLISKGRCEEGIESFEWYRCKNEAAQKELTDVLEEQKNKEQNKQELNCTEILDLIFSKRFFKAYSTGFALFTAIQFCGLNNFIFYAQELLKPIFSDKIDGYLLMIIVDSLRVFSNVILIPVLKYFPRRKSLFVFTSTIVLLLVGKIVYLIVEPTGFTWLLLFFLITYTLVGGVMISVAWTFVSEIFPNEIRGFGSGMSSSTSYLLLFLSVIVTPEIMERFGIIAVYSTYAIVTSVSSIILFLLLPDTDGKSLHEIEQSYKT